MHEENIKLQKLGLPRDEVDRYLKQYGEADYFAAIKVGGESVIADMAKSLQILYGSGLLPVVVHGGGPQINEALKAEGIETKTVKGKRVTDEQTLGVVVRTLTGVNENFVFEINSAGDIAKGLNGVFHVDRPDETYDYVGNVIGVDRSAIDMCLNEKRIPVVSSLGKDNGGHWYNPNADASFGFLVSELNPCKVIFLTSVGGVYDEKEELVSEMDADELRLFIESGKATGGMQVKLEEAYTLAVSGHDVQITAPEHLIKELFSDEGCGTYIHC